MDLKLLGDHWNRYGQTDPLWAILSETERKDGGWDKRDFFWRGMEDVNYSMQMVRDIQFPLRQGTALDFGCGVGRLTQGLACYFDEVHGVDIAASMIEQARLYNPYEDRVRFHVNTRDDLRIFKDNQFDFVFSLIVLQHIRADYVRRYIAEFMRILAPGGLLLFQHPSHHSPAKLNMDYEPRWFQFRRNARVWTRETAERVKCKVTGKPAPEPFEFTAYAREKHDYLPPIVDWDHALQPAAGAPQSNASSDPQRITTVVDTPRYEHHPIKRRNMLAYLKRVGGQVLDVRQRAESGEHWHSYRYFVTK